MSNEPRQNKIFVHWPRPAMKKARIHFKLYVYFICDRSCSFHFGIVVPFGRFTCALHLSVDSIYHEYERSMCAFESFKMTAHQFGFGHCKLHLALCTFAYNLLLFFLLSAFFVCSCLPSIYKYIYVHNSMLTKWPVSAEMLAAQMFFFLFFFVSLFRLSSVMAMQDDGTRT